MKLILFIALLAFGAMCGNALWKFDVKAIENLRDVEIPFTVCGAHTDPLVVEKITTDIVPVKGKNITLTIVKPFWVHY